MLSTAVDALILARAVDDEARHARKNPVQSGTRVSVRVPVFSSSDRVFRATNQNTKDHPLHRYQRVVNLGTLPEAMEGPAARKQQVSDETSAAVMLLLGQKKRSRPKARPGAA